MEIRVIRNQSFATCVQSRILIDGVPKFYGLEPPFSELSGGPICIPEGTYEVWLRWSPKFSMWVPVVMSVQGRMDIEIHPGNEPADTAGCLLIGCQSAPGYISESRTAFGALIEGIKQSIPSERVTVRYVNQFGETPSTQPGPAWTKTAAALLLCVLMMFAAPRAHAQQVSAPPQGQTPLTLQAKTPFTGLPSTSRLADAPVVPVEVTRADNPINRAFIFAESIRWAAAVADFETTRRYVSAGRCVESAPLLGQAPSAARMYGAGIPIEAGVSAASYLLQRCLRRNSRADRTAALLFIEGGVTAAHAYAAAHNGRCL